MCLSNLCVLSTVNSVPFKYRADFNHLEKAVQYKYRLCKAIQDGTRNEPVPSREIQVFPLLYSAYKEGSTGLACTLNVYFTV